MNIGTDVKGKRYGGVPKLQFQRLNCLGNVRRGVPIDARHHMRRACHMRRAVGHGEPRHLQRLCEIRGTIVEAGEDM